jgi:uncharacterized linocin/CFP29 family protein
MDFLMRDDSKLSAEQWQIIDQKVIAAAKSVLVGRKFLDIYGPLGAGIPTLDVTDSEGQKKPVTIPLIASDFTLSWRELQTAETLRIPMSYAQVASAAVDCALQEEKLIFLGDEDLGCSGLLSTPGVKKVKMQDWGDGENAFADIVSGLQHMLEHQTYGGKVLVASPDVYAKLQRIQPGTGHLESKRISALIEGKIYQTPIMPEKTAILIATGEQNMDLAIGQDMITGYLGSEALDHDFRIFETVLPRIKNKHAIVVYEG